MSGERELRGPSKQTSADDLTKAGLPHLISGADAVKELAEVRELMGAQNAFGPDSYLRGLGGDTGPVAELPESLIAKLNQECPFTEDHKTYETHQLVLVPVTLDGEDYTVNELRRRASQVTDRVEGEVFLSQVWCDKEDFANTCPDGSYWSLVFKRLLPDSKNRKDAGQLMILDRDFPEYETAPSLDVFTNLALDLLCNGNRRHADECGRLAERPSKNARVATGRNDLSGLPINLHPDSFAGPDLGRFVRLKLNN